MAQIKIYHNPRCSKSRQALALLEERGIRPEIVEYLETPPTREEIEDLLKKLGKSPIDIMRTKESIFQELGLGERKDDSSALIDAIVKHPVLLERPIVVSGPAAKIGRPPEDVLEIL